MQRQPKKLSKNPTCYVPDRENLSISSAKNQSHILTKPGPCPWTWLVLPHAEKSGLAVPGCCWWPQAYPQSLCELLLWVPGGAAFLAHIVHIAPQPPLKEKNKSIDDYLSISVTVCVLLCKLWQTLVLMSIYPWVKGAKKWCRKFLDDSNSQFSADISEPSL